MNYQLLSKTTPKAKKEYKCVWCPEKILRGEKHIKEVGTYDGFFYRRWHTECWEASQKYFSENPYECEIYPHECKRGTFDHMTDSDWVDLSENRKTKLLNEIRKDVEEVLLTFTAELNCHKTWEKMCLKLDDMVRQKYLLPKKIYTWRVNIDEQYNNYASIDRGEVRGRAFIKLNNSLEETWIDFIIKPETKEKEWITTCTHTQIFDNLHRYEERIPSKTVCVNVHRSNHPCGGWNFKIKGDPRQLWVWYDWFLVPNTPKNAQIIDTIENLEKQRDEIHEDINYFRKQFEK